MKRLLFGSALATTTLFCGCVSQSDHDALSADFRALSERVSRIEGDLYKVEVKAAPKQEKKIEPKFVPTKEVEQSVIDTKINAFLREYLGVAFGDSIDKYPKAIEGRDYLYERYRVITVLKKFQYFDKALAHFEDGKLYAVSFFADIDNKYSIDSTNERITQTKADLAATFGLASDAFNRRSGLLSLRQRRAMRAARRENNTKGATTSYRLGDCSSELAPNGYRRLGVIITDENLRRQIQSEKAARERAKGEQLPEAK